GNRVRRVFSEFGHSRRWVHQSQTFRSGEMTQMAQRRCPSCQQPDRLITIDMEVTRGAVAMTRCTDCEVRWWEQNGRRIAFETLRELAAPDHSRPHHMQRRRFSAA